MNSSALESRDHGLEITSLAASIQLVTEHSLKGATNYGNRATGVGTKHAVLRPRPRPGSSGLETETFDFRSRDQGRDLGLQVSRPRPRPWPSVSRPRQNELESRDNGLEITTLVFSIVITYFIKLYIMQQQQQKEYMDKTKWLQTRLMKIHTNMHTERQYAS